MHCYSYGKIDHHASNCRLNKNWPAGKAFLVDNEFNDEEEASHKEEAKDDEVMMEDKQIVNANFVQTSHGQKHFPHSQR